MILGMGNVATPEMLVGRWDEMCRDPALQDMPYKIELNAWGKIEMSPVSNRHGRLQAALAADLQEQLSGAAFIRCCILTRIGIRVADVAWASDAFLQRYGEMTPYTVAPEICVEIVSPSTVQAEVEEKTAAYLAAGADEVWIASLEGTVRYFGAAGESLSSVYPITRS
jgi:Uma2 family endonuclease